MKNKTSIIGKQGEDIAAAYLSSKGYQILCRNWRHKHQEIDLIVQKANIIIFVEVKTRSGTSYGRPEQFVDRAKERALENASLEYIYQQDYTGEIRYDIVSIVLNQDRHQLVHLEDAFFPGMS